MPTHDIEEDDEDVDREAALQPINYNISRDEALEQLKLTQLYAMKLLEELRQLRQDNSELRAAAPKKRRRGQAEDVLGYKIAIVGIAKAFLFTRAFILPRGAFQSAKPDPPSTPRDQFTSDEAFTTSTAIALYEEVPTKFHSLLNPKTEPAFSNDFIHEHSDGRSIFLNTLRKAMPNILRDKNVSADLLITAKAARGKDPVLLGLLKFEHESRSSRFPPTHRLMFFGPGSLVPDAKPAPHSNGMKLGFKTVKSSSMSAAAIALRFVLSADTEWSAKGTVTGINWEGEYRAYMELLEAGKHKPHIQRIFKTVYNFVFAGVDMTIDNNNTGDADVDADELNELMRRFELGADGSDDDEPGPAAAGPVSTPPSPVTPLPVSPVTSAPASPVISAPPPAPAPLPPRTRKAKSRQVIADSEEDEVVARGPGSQRYVFGVHIVNPRSIDNGGIEDNARLGVANMSISPQFHDSNSSLPLQPLINPQQTLTWFGTHLPALELSLNPRRPAASVQRTST
ncbi:hypothetical protein K438DRAFT_1991606 [Mycena galopus ATCC 62051]|nr:hypothetical protein K438DRAFT_1991606 [Mycena galopus ATCC 62051]